MSQEFHNRNVLCKSVYCELFSSNGVWRWNLRGFEDESSWITVESEKFFCVQNIFRHWKSDKRQIGGEILIVRTKKKRETKYKDL